MTTGQKVKALRKQKGFTQEELAHKLGYKSKTSIAHIETNRDLPIDIICKLAKVLGTSPAYLMGWERDPKKVYYVFHNIERISDEQFDLLISFFDKLIAENE